MKMISLLLIGLLIIPTALAATVKIYPSDDAYVRGYSSTTKNTNYGSDATLETGFNGLSKGAYKSYMMFDLSSLNGKNITSASLSIEPNNIKAQTPTVRVYLSGTNWNEETVTWNTQPSYTTLVGSRQLQNLDRVSIQITSPVNGSKVSFALIEAGEDQYIQLFSKDYAMTHNVTEDSTRWPYLEVTYGESECNTVADANCDGQVSLTEYNDFKYAYKAGLLPGVTLTQYNDIKYQFKNGLLN